MNTALEYSTRVVQEGGRRCKKSTLNDLVHLTPLRIPLMNPPQGSSQMVQVYQMYSICFQTGVSVVPVHARLIIKMVQVYLPSSFSLLICCT
jgi:hypothetical protein